MLSAYAPQETDRAARSSFIDLVCADQELLRSEFEEIIATSWGEPPRRRPCEWPAPGERPGDTWATRLGTVPRSPSSTPAYRNDEWSRQRSPPTPTTPS